MLLLAEVLYQAIFKKPQKHYFRKLLPIKRQFIFLCYIVILKIYQFFNFTVFIDETSLQKKVWSKEYQLYTSQKNINYVGKKATTSYQFNKKNKNTNSKFLDNICLMANPER